MKYILISAIVLLFGCCSTSKVEKTTQEKTKTASSNPISKEKAVEYQMVYTSTDSGSPSEKMTVIDDADVFNGIWAETNRNSPTPEVDFENQTVIMCAIGEKFSGGYAVKAHSAIENELQITVTFEATHPGKNCITTEALTYPITFISVAKTDKKIELKKIIKITKCD
ncbi:protease complex subunit PrcB family protein [bacterium]|nr:protease complex subunit PrcB family protein [bacterium]